MHTNKVYVAQVLSEPGWYPIGVYKSALGAMEELSKRIDDLIWDHADGPDMWVGELEFAGNSMAYALVTSFELQA